MAGHEPSEADPLLPHTQVAHQQPPRIAYLDHFRVFLTVLVVYHHAATFYLLNSEAIVLPEPKQPDALFSLYQAPYTRFLVPSEKEHNKPCSMTCQAAKFDRLNPLLFFMTMNESFFMHSFFFMSGYFSYGALKRKKSIKLFLRDKFKRLGIPLVLFALFQIPILDQIKHPGHFGYKLVCFWKTYTAKWGASTSQVWFLQTLLNFDIALAVWFHFAHRQKLPAELRVQPDIVVPPPWSGPRFITTLMGLLTLLVPLCFFLRIHSGLYDFVVPAFGFPGQLPVFILAYISGMHLPKLRPHLISTKYVWWRLVISYLFAGTTLFLLSEVFGATIVNPFGGGWDAKWVFFEAWNEVSLFLLGTAWLSLFFSYDETQGQNTPSPIVVAIRAKTSAFLNPRYAYTVYLIHLVPLEAMIYFLRLIPSWGPCLSYAICIPRAIFVGTLIVIGSWIAARIVVMIPGVGGIL